MMRICNLLVWCLFGLTASTSLFGQSSSFELASTDQFPRIIVDTNQYSFELHLVNTDPVHNLEGPISIYMSVDSDPATKLVPDILTQTPLAPGDSVVIPVVGYHFDAARFGGGGVTHDIIVWPMRVGFPPQDSTTIPVYFIDSSHPGAMELGLEVSSFPTQIRENDSYNLTFEVFNQDEEFLLYQPVSIYMNVDGGNPVQLLENYLPDSPVEPGHSFMVDVPAYTFDPPSFANAPGGGVTHDIIVWPMKIGSPLVDTTEIEVQYFDRAAFSMFAGVIGLPETPNLFVDYNIIVAAENIGAGPNTNPIDFFIQLDNQAPQLLFQSSLLVGVGNLASNSFPAFAIGDYFGYTLADTAFATVGHELTFWAVEQNACQWYEAARYTTVPTIYANEEDQGAEAINGGAPTDSSASVTLIEPANVSEQAFNQHNSPGAFFRPRLSPNPFQEQLEIRSLLPLSGQVTVDIFSPAYLPVLQKRWGSCSPGDQLIINTATLKAGLYIYRLEVNGQTYFGKLLRE